MDRMSLCDKVIVSQKVGLALTRLFRWQQKASQHTDDRVVERLQQLPLCM